MYTTSISSRNNAKTTSNIHFETQTGERIFLVAATASYVEMVEEGLVAVWVGFDGVCEEMSLFGQVMEMTMDIYQIIKWFNCTRQHVCHTTF